MASASRDLPEERNLLEQWAINHFSRISHQLKQPEIIFSSAMKPCFVMKLVSNAKTWDDLDKVSRIRCFELVIRFCLDCHLNADKIDLPPALRDTSRQMSYCIETLTFRLPQSYSKTTYSGLRSKDLVRYSEERRELQTSRDVQRLNLSALDHYRRVQRNIVHGDLHNLSILGSDDSFFLIDPEFARIGCSSFDAGVFIAHVILHSVVAHGREGSSFDISSFLESTRARYFRDSNEVQELWPQVQMFCLNEIFAKIAGPIPSYWINTAPREVQGQALSALSSFLIRYL
ncbi:MAG: hypothetical protein AAFY56_10635 [Pseudomonadota bacterium]